MTDWLLLVAVTIVVQTVLLALIHWVFPSKQSQRGKIIELLLVNGTMTGLDLVKASNGIVKRGLVYIVLDDLMHDGLVMIDRTAGPRKHYMLRVQPAPQGDPGLPAARKQIEEQQDTIMEYSEGVAMLQTTILEHAALVQGLWDWYQSTAEIDKDERLIALCRRAGDLRSIAARDCGDGCAGCLSCLPNTDAPDEVTKNRERVKRAAEAVGGALQKSPDSDRQN